MFHISQALISIFYLIVSYSIQEDTECKEIFRTIGQGNCLFNACSIALLGDETIADSLRCLTAIELYTNCSYYANHPLIEIQHSIGAFQNINNAFAMHISNESLISSGGKNHCLAVRDEAAYS